MIYEAWGRRVRLLFTGVERRAHQVRIEWIGAVLIAITAVYRGEIVIEIIVTGVDEIVLLGAVVVCEIHEDKIVIDLDEVKEMID